MPSFFESEFCNNVFYEYQLVSDKRLFARSRNRNVALATLQHACVWKLLMSECHRQTPRDERPHEVPPMKDLSSNLEYVWYRRRSHRIAEVLVAKSMCSTRARTARLTVVGSRLDSLTCESVFVSRKDNTLPSSTAKKGTVWTPNMFSEIQSRASRKKPATCNNTADTVLKLLAATTYAWMATSWTSPDAKVTVCKHWFSASAMEHVLIESFSTPVFRPEVFALPTR